MFCCGKTTEIRNAKKAKASRLRLAHIVGGRSSSIEHHGCCRHQEHLEAVRTAVAVEVDRIAVAGVGRTAVAGADHTAVAEAVRTDPAVAADHTAVQEEDPREERIGPDQRVVRVHRGEHQRAGRSSAVHHQERNRGMCLVVRVAAAGDILRKKGDWAEQREEERIAGLVERRTTAAVGAVRTAGAGRHRRRPCCPERDLVLLRVLKRDPWL